METPTIESLIERARGGDDAAFEDLCARYESAIKARIRPWIGGALRRKVSVLDVLQDVYIEAHRGLPAFDPRGPGAFGAWIIKIAELKAKEAVRRFSGTMKRDATREVSRDARAATGNVPGCGPSPSEVAMGEEKREEIIAAMAGLPPDYRRVIELLQLGRLPLETVASMLGRTPQATRRLYSRALGRLADRLDPKREDETNES